jgi:E3 ubiquitin-protein ligase synoviolin
VAWNQNFSIWSKIRLGFFLVHLGFLDMVITKSLVLYVLRSERTDSTLLFTFEVIFAYIAHLTVKFAVLFLSASTIFTKYLLTLVDLRLNGQWEDRAFYTFYIELSSDFSRLALYCIFCYVIMV